MTTSTPGPLTVPSLAAQRAASTRATIRRRREAASRAALLAAVPAPLLTGWSR